MSLPLDGPPLRSVMAARRSLRRPRRTAWLAWLAWRSVVPCACVALVAACGSHDGDFAAAGTIEIVETDVAPMVPARVLDVRVEEGARVRVGDTLALLSQATLQPEIEQRRARVAAAEAALRDLEAGARPAEVRQAAATFQAAEAEALRTRRDLERLEPLAASGTVSRQQLDAARAAATAAQGRLDAARAALRLVQEGARVQRIAAARAEVQSARALLAAAVATASDLVLTSPVAGVVLDRHAEPGEVLAAGESALTLGDPARPWVRVFLSPAELPRVRVGERVTAVLDAFPDTIIAGRVVAISPRAEFTPRVALTERERADLLFGVKVMLDDRHEMVKSGLPITVRFPSVAAPADSR
ncbi:MAG TPA: HlyD family efflux transporter periplasmic adaptor subunit [Gemmatimonadaceae bacterium]|nr:HlyD family efflux transporter periplasmic adaptor subunit [Gemmatimonadaceae bacterium]